MVQDYLTIQAISIASRAKENSKNSQTRKIKNPVTIKPKSNICFKIKSRIKTTRSSKRAALTSHQQNISQTNEEEKENNPQENNSEKENKPINLLHLKSLDDEELEEVDDDESNFKIDSLNVVKKSLELSKDKSKRIKKSNIGYESLTSSKQNDIEVDEIDITLSEV
ncbi:hypothetical protein RhiirA4_475647 [Rhizophagus irregularis]|uniref:Uncharacterized protein n=1 Tax=Rhizophagus irregularis TaxID=588596 RepID=A0A2I1HAG2_9GLOM|nr:hypothetical protein RhiirA4_475647 [Rhizophagus irregularis]